MIVRSGVVPLLDRLQLDSDGIYSAPLNAATLQADEIRERQSVARRVEGDLLAAVGRHHSIPVMDRELLRFLGTVPRDGVILDAGTGWAWPWRNVDAVRPDVCVVALDLVRENLRHAVRVLGRLVNTQVFLVHGDATALPFPPMSFDGYWSVQTLQHVPEFDVAVREAWRVLRPRGVFASYSLNRPLAIEYVYRLARRRFHTAGKTAGGFYLTRASAAQAAVVNRVFAASVTTRFTEMMFHPDLGIRTGTASSWIGAADARLSSRLSLLACLARQRSFHARKPAEC